MRQQSPTMAAPIHAHRSIDNDHLPLRILVQSDMIGAIIGRSGNTIKQITQEAKSKIDVDREDRLDQMDRVVTINGPPDGCSQACSRILKIIQEEQAQLSRHISPLNEIQLRILAHNNLIGRLIGKNGITIRKIMDQTFTRINISTNCLTDSTQERTINVSGTFENVSRAQQVIYSKLRAAYVYDISFTIRNMNQQPYSYNSVPSLSYVPRSYAQNPSILANLVNPQAGQSGFVMPRGYSAPQRGNPRLPPLPIYPSNTNYLPFYPNLGQQMGAGLVGFNAFMAARLDNEKVTVHIYVPSSAVGAIIGKSGSAIKEMISTSGASIKIETSTPHHQLANGQGQTTNPQSENNQSCDKNHNSNSPDKVSDPQITVATSENTNESEKTKVNETCSDDPGKEQNGSSKVSDVGRQTIVSNNAKQMGSNQDQAQSSIPQTRKVTIIGTPESQWSAQYMLYRKVSTESNKPESNLIVEIQIPSTLVGKIIGKGGSTIKQLQKQTRTTIRLVEEKPPGAPIDGNESAGETLVQITGEFQNTQMAQWQIRSLIKEGVM